MPRKKKDDELTGLREEVERLKTELEDRRRRADENLSGWQRAQADFSNYRKRQEQERSDMVRFAEMRLVVDLLPVVDDFERAWQTLPGDLRTITWIQGVHLIDQKLRAILSTHGLSPIEALGKEFDPHTHEAVMREEGEPAELTTVVAEFQKGYRLHDRVVRPSMVKVGKRAAEPAATEAEAGG